MKVVDLNFSGDKIIVEAIPGSSNGRTGDSGSSNRGSNPCPGAILKTGIRPVFLHSFFLGFSAKEIQNSILFLHTKPAQFCVSTL